MSEKGKTWNEFLDGITKIRLYYKYYKEDKNTA